MHPGGAGDGGVRAAVVLAGGGSRRLGRDKLAVDLGGTTVIDHLLDGLAGALPGVPLLLVGPVRAVVHEVRWCREEPVGAGPAAGLAAAARALGRPPTSGRVVVVAGDLPFAGDAVPALLAAVGTTPDADAWLALDRAGVTQPLLGVHRLAVLAGGRAGGSVRSLLEGRRVVGVDVPPHAALDVDTEDDVAAARARVRASS
ncbi:hypothetical protein GCM10027446_33140 [Angustibacter peucedani]